MPARPSRFLFGAAYYPEYHPDVDVATDLDLMAAAHFSVIRVGESVWSTWEPADGRFDLEWLAPTLDGAHERGISVILGTPTYAVPPWLVRRHPEIAGEIATGQRIAWGARQEVDTTHPAFLFHAERVVRAILGRYADHPAVIGFQVDNEPGLHLLHNHGVFQRFVDDLRDRYGDVETLNREWGLVYWSHRLSTWADLWPPDGNAQPQYDLAWRRFQARLTTEFITWQAGVVREYAGDRFVSTCLSYDRPAVEDDQLTAALDLTMGNTYYTMQDGLALPAPDDRELVQGWTTQSTWALYQSADRMFASRQERFLVAETDAQSIGMPWVNRPAYDGQWRQAGWALAARGASMIEYWHWRTLHEGSETYWGGVLPHSGRPGRVYRELAALGAELEAAGDLVAGAVPDHDVTIVWSTPSAWAMAGYPPLSRAGDVADEASYRQILDPFYRGAFDAGAQVRLLHVGQLGSPDPDPDPGPAAAALAAAHPVLVVPGLYIADDATLDLLAAYAAAGGHLVLGPRTGYGDQEARARHEVAPGRLADAAGTWYDEFSNIDSDVAVTPGSAAGFDLPPGCRATRWIDGLQVDTAQLDSAQVDEAPVEGAPVVASRPDAPAPDGARPGDPGQKTADVLVGYDHPHFGRWAAVTTRAHGAGRVTTVGTVPNPELAMALFTWLVPGLNTGWHRTPPSVTSTSATCPDGTTIHFVHNWSWTPAELPLPASVTDAVSGEPQAQGDLLRLGPWNVRVLHER